jgi:hypothetical protein
VGAFGTNNINAGVTLGSSVSLQLSGLAIANPIQANYAVFQGGSAYVGTVTVPPFGVAELSIGNPLSGTANVNAGGRLKVFAPHTGSVDSSGSTEVSASTAGATPLNNYAGNCGSKYLREA